MDVRIDPTVSTVPVVGIGVQVSALLLPGVPRGAVVIVAGPVGLSGMETVDTMNLLAQHGYESVLAQPPDAGLSDDLGRAVVHHLLDRVAARGWIHEQVGMIGYGNGARAALVAGSEATFGAAISVPCDARQLLLPYPIKTLRTPWLGMAGLGSGRRLIGDLAVYRNEVRAASTEHTSVIGYPGVAHCLHDSTEALAHAAVFDSWQRTVEWLNIHVAPRPTPLAEAWRKHQQIRPPALNREPTDKGVFRVPVHR